MGSRVTVSWASLLPLFSLLRFSVLDLGSDTGQTDRQTTAIIALWPALWVGLISQYVTDQVTEMNCVSIEIQKLPPRMNFYTLLLW